ncbi:gamma-glutamyl-gamma-aminobutyrate hydrolase family protein [Streptococcus sp. DD13]|uniref:gamma-glutamyl-gamma-aminobutyrate hydrolase family protein n=1 Tax=Streptococcus sp. DD13 TaxID=1777881 RepID=UPI00079662E4|nr:gamma-glutamyl-gamma-aminobutyrate hydrolase family protein [Streptococcus sp. DD13]KXT78136.1 Glutamine amidotransferase, class I [Streptococcus sp. DD13]
MAKPIIGISGNELPIPRLTAERYDLVPSGLSEGVRQSGGIPFVIPLGKPELAADYIASIDKLILSGGQDVYPKWYGEEDHGDPKHYFLERDYFEVALIVEALKQGKPIFAVCRGMQLLNVALGGSLHQDVSNHWQDEKSGTSHRIQVQTGSLLSQLCGEGIEINSFHHQSIKKLGYGLEVTARDPRDGTIEAYEDRKNRLIGIQWHPEFLIQKCPCNQKLFQFFVNEV